MGTRTLERRRDHLMTIAMAPFMSCGARLPVYALFAAAFFPRHGQNLVFELYLLGIFAAVLTGLILKKTLLRGETTPFIMELPPYHLPTLKGILIHTWNRLKGFIVKAGRIILPMVVVLSFLNNIGPDGSFTNQNTGKSMLATIGRAITPVFSPMGLREENWPASVGIFTGVLAKEAVIGTLNAEYAAIAGANESEEDDSISPPQSQTPSRRFRPISATPCISGRIRSVLARRKIPTRRRSPQEMTSIARSSVPWSRALTGQSVLLPTCCSSCYISLYRRNQSGL